MLGICNRVNGLFVSVDCFYPPMAFSGPCGVVWQGLCGMARGCGLSVGMGRTVMCWEPDVEAKPGWAGAVGSLYTETT